MQFLQLINQCEDLSDFINLDFDLHVRRKTCLNPKEWKGMMAFQETWQNSKNKKQQQQQKNPTKVTYLFILELLHPSWNQVEISLRSKLIYWGKTSANIRTQSVAKFAAILWGLCTYSLFLHFYLLILEREGNRDRKWERVKHQFAVLPIYAFIGWFLYVPWPGIELTNLVHWNSTPTNWATQPGQCTCSWYNTLSQGALHSGVFIFWYGDTDTKPQGLGLARQ